MGSLQGNSGHVSTITIGTYVTESFTIVIKLKSHIVFLSFCKVNVNSEILSKAKILVYNTQNIPDPST